MFELLLTYGDWIVLAGVTIAALSLAKPFLTLLAPIKSVVLPIWFLVLVLVIGISNIIPILIVMGLSSIALTNERAKS